MASPMSRGKLRVVGLCEICADCGAIDPTWASINRGILLCDECCSIHRSLGRHISQIKSLKKGLWSPTLLQMVHTLNTNGVNSIWEHSLLDPTNSKSGRRKPQPKDLIHPVKADFIRAKHQMLAFVFRPGKDDTLLLKSDLSKQLHASVRTANLETSLRLLSQGADPNYFHQEKGTTPLHVAAKAGQLSQVELLVVYGADPGALDNQGKTPIDYARSAGYRDLSDRLSECIYELTDRLAYYLCSRKPDHQNGQHYIVPEMSDSLDLTELAKAAKRKLQLLPNHLFEELAMDVYDEVDRRETETIWLTTQQPSSPLALDRCTVPFLPVNPEFSSTRNQGRQKLARFNAREFATLIIDILSDAKRRQAPTTSSLILLQDNKILKGPFVNISNSALLLNRKSEVSDDEPLYDSVASDEDYITTEQMALLKQQANRTVQEAKEKSEESLTFLEPDKDSNCPKSNGIENKVAPSKTVNGGVLSIEQNLRRQLSVSETIINELKSEIYGLQSTIQNLLHENNELRNTVQQAGLPVLSASRVIPNGCETEQVLEVKSPRSSTQRPASMYEPREGLLHRSTGNIHHYVSAAGNIGLRDKSAMQKRDIGNELYDCPNALVRPVATQSMYQCLSPKSSPKPSDVGMPPAEEVVRKTDQVTKRIQELWASMQEPDEHNAFVPCAERIQVAVTELIAIFPQNLLDDHVCVALRQLSGNTDRLQTECAGLQQSTTEVTQVAERAYFLQQVRACAYDIAKATKQLVTRFQY